MEAFLTKIGKMKPFYDTVSNVLMVTCKMLLIVDILIAAVSVFGNYISFLPDSAEARGFVMTSMSYVAVLSAALTIRSKKHIRLTTFDRFLPAKLLKVLDLVTDVGVMILGFVLLGLGMTYVFALESDGIDVTDFWKYFPIPTAGFLMAFYELEAIGNDLKAFYKSNTDYDLKNEAERIIEEAKS